MRIISEIGFVPGISREFPDFSGNFPGNKKLTGFPGNFPGIPGIFVAFPVSRFPGNEKSGKFQTLVDIDGEEKTFSSRHFLAD